MSDATIFEVGETATLDDMIAWASLTLPEQGPLPSFVHHNTLHHFEHLPFSQGVLEGARVFGSQPYPSEVAFGRHLDSGRIDAWDIERILAVEHPVPGDPLFAGGPTLSGFRAFRLQHAIDIPQGRAVDWFVHEEGEALARPFPAVSPARVTELTHLAEALFPDSSTPLARLLERLWEQFETVTPPRTGSALASPRPRDHILTRFGVDTDLATHSLLIRFTASYLDQGLSYWTMPGRETGMLRTFRTLYGQRGGPPDVAFRGLDVELRRQQTENWDAERTIVWALERMGVARKDWATVLRSTLQSLRGWAGMVRQFERRPHWAPVQAPPARLNDYLAIHLLLDWCGFRNVSRDKKAEPIGADGPVEEANSSLTYEAFILAQLSPLDANLFLQRVNAAAWVNAVAEFDDLERRRLWHLAYEHHYRTDVLDALGEHVLNPEPTPERATYQAVFCIDDREESLRRHLEETFPDVQTFGMAGFFGVAMEYQGLHDVRPRALCPVVITPKHLVREVALDEAAHAGLVAKRSQTGRTEHAFAVGTRTLVRGSLLSAGLGLAALVPLVGRSLFPRAVHRWLETHAVTPATRLAVEHTPGTPTESGLKLGYTVGEMTDIVENTLRTLGLTTGLGRLVAFVGHGSSSLNNPHKAAYDCGATGGGKGGPNARAFAVMANHPDVRRELAQRGLTIPAETRFLGAFHDTSDDSMTYYDTDLMSEAETAVFELLREAFARACALDAQERCRRFVHAPLDPTPQEALCHVQARAVDIGQPRPECGHATNATCIVGRRERTRGLFLDRRAFLVTYDSKSDPTEEVLGNLLQAVCPVGAGINLEYYFSYVDPQNHGCGSKLPHNLVGLFAVMDGHASDLRTGLPWQMVEIHEPVRLLTIVEAKCEVLQRLVERRPALAPLIQNEWLQLVSLDPDSADMFVFRAGEFRPYTPRGMKAPRYVTSADAYGGHRDNLPCAHIGRHWTGETSS